jgi:hypothetical protein
MLARRHVSLNAPLEHCSKDLVWATTDRVKEALEVQAFLLEGSFLPFQESDETMGCVDL